MLIYKSHLPAVKDNKLGNAMRIFLLKIWQRFEHVYKDEFKRFF